MKRDNKLYWFLDRYLELILGLVLFIIILVAAIRVIFYSNKGKLMVCDYCNKIIETGVDDYLVTPKGDRYHAECYMNVLKEEKQ